jgi:hypothetical protein
VFEYGSGHGVVIETFEMLFKLELISGGRLSVLVFEIKV